MNIGIFIEKCRSLGYGEEAIAKFKKAVKLAEEALKDKKRLSGEPAFNHNLRVGLILAENRSVPEAVIAGLLHGLPLQSKEAIKDRFGQEILSLVEQTEEVKIVKYLDKKLEAEALRRILLTALKDVRVIFIKLANRLDNLHSIEVHPKKEQERIAQEVLEVYAPLAYHLGLDKIRARLEDQAFKILNPRKYREIADFLEESQEGRESSIAGAVELVKKAVSDKVSIIKIKGRPKHIYSIYKKITQRGVRLDEQYDLLGIRIIVPEVKDCYTLLGLLHESFEPVEGRLKDYIANPKPNFYRSIHTAIRLPEGKIAEIQIRTQEMDAIAEEGIAAHAKYKGVTCEQLFEQKVTWLKGILDLQRDAESKEFLETVKVDIFGDKIYCYTPKGNLKELPAEATVLDFAYAVHEEIGKKAVAGRVNGKFVPLRYKLEQGDVIEVLTNKNQHPRRDWIKFVKSGKTKQKIRKFLKKHEKLPVLHYHLFKPRVKEELGVLTESEEFPKASCVLAKCCRPLPGDFVAGILTKHRIISVHKEDCRIALKLEERWLPVNWKNEFNQKIRFFVDSSERSGLLADLLHTIAAAGFEVKEAKAKLIGPGNVQCSFAIIPRDLEHLKELVGRVKKVQGIRKIYFE